MRPMETVKMEAAATALNKMFQGRCFDICTMDTIFRMLYNASPGGEAWDVLRALHCVHWSDMSETLRSEVRMLIAQVLSLPLTSVATFTTVESVPVVKVQPRLSFFQKVVNKLN